jgi:hypothetical protein
MANLLLQHKESLIRPAIAAFGRFQGLDGDVSSLNRLRILVGLISAISAVKVSGY